MTYTHADFTVSDYPVNVGRSRYTVCCKICGANWELTLPDTDFDEGVNNKGFVLFQAVDKGGVIHTAACALKKAANEAVVR